MLNGWVYSALISVRLWDFKDGGSQQARFLAKNQYSQRKRFKIPSTYDSSSKIGHDFRIENLDLESPILALFDRPSTMAEMIKGSF